MHNERSHVLTGSSEALESVCFVVGHRLFSFGNLFSIIAVLNVLAVITRVVFQMTIEIIFKKRVLIRRCVT